MTEPEPKPAFEPAELARTYADIAQRSSQMVSRYLASHQANGNVSASKTSVLSVASCSVRPTLARSCGDRRGVICRPNNRKPG